MSNEKASVLHIHFWADIRNSSGSVEKVITAFASHGQRYRHMIACCPGERGTMLPFEHHGVLAYPFRENRLVNRALNKILGLNAFTYGDLVRQINRLRPAVLHFHNRQELVDAVVSRLDYRPAVVVHYHRHFAEPVVPKLVDRLIFISRRTADDILGKTGCTMTYSIVFNPLSLEVLGRAGQVEAVPVCNPIPVILFGGGGNPIKGGKELIEAFATLPAGSAHLILAGRNVEKLSGLPHPGIEVLGEVPATRFFDLMLTADIVTMPSYDEPFGLIAQEAMLLRKLLVVAGSGGLAEFTGSDCAIVIEPKSVNSLSQGLQQALVLLNQSSALQEKLDSAFERVAAFFPPVVASELEDVYDVALDAVQ
jgi:glycosyltransferase involved in cell wall biosynthesis